MKGFRNPVRGENEVHVGFTRLSLGAGKWGNHGVLVMRLPESTVAHSALADMRIQFSSSHVKMFTCLCINQRHVENVQMHVLTTCLSACTCCLDTVTFWRFRGLELDLAVTRFSSRLWIQLCPRPNHPSHNDKLFQHASEKWNLEELFFHFLVKKLMKRWIRLSKS